MEFSVDEKLKLANEMCNSNYANTHKFSYIYPFTTENISAYLPFFEIEGKSLFTVGSSCDQALNVILCGAKGITVFDICPFTEEYFNLKKAAIMTLTRDEFLSFFCYCGYPNNFFTNKQIFNESLYPKIREVLGDISPEARYFWNEIFGKYNGVFIRKNLFSMDENRYRTLMAMNNYLSSDSAYYELGNKLNKNNVDFVCGDIFKDQIRGNYDNIFLSNLSTYCKLDELKGLFNKMLLNLNDDGKIMIAYLYETDIHSDDYMDGEAEIYNLPKVFETFPKDINFITFIGVRGIRFKSGRLRDSIITYRKVKKK